MDPELIERLNDLWAPIYPFMAEWAARWWVQEEGRLLELGPFSGGIGAAFTARYPGLRMTCVLSETHVVPAIRRVLGPKAALAAGLLDHIPLQSVFDLVVFRGAFFFLTPAMLPEIQRVLKPGAYALVGGGFGPLTPPEKIAPIARESKDLNYRLGKKWISRYELEQMVDAAGCRPHTRILEEGGMWLLLGKPPA